jgi:hypothetical protein
VKSSHPGMLFPRENIHDEEEALSWWEGQFAAGCESLNAQVNAAALVRAMVESLRTIRRESGDAALKLSEAARESGYSRDHLGREIRAGRIPNAGRPSAPRIERRHLPHKSGTLPSAEPGNMLVRRQIALSVVTSDNE